MVTTIGMLFKRRKLAEYMFDYVSQLPQPKDDTKNLYWLELEEWSDSAYRWFCVNFNMKDDSVLCALEQYPNKEDF